MLLTMKSFQFEGNRAHGYYTAQVLDQGSLFQG